MQKTCYLGGTITDDPLTWEWRATSTKYLEDRDIKVLNPLRGIDLKSIGDEGFRATTPMCLSTLRDWMDLDQSDIVLCNLTFVPERQSIGTFMELGYAVANKIPFIVVSNHERIIAHPFITETAVQVLSDLEEALAAVVFILS